jgi:hypothetical protein
LDSGNAGAFYGKIAVFFPTLSQPGESSENGAENGAVNGTVKAAWH